MPDCARQIKGICLFSARRGERKWKVESGKWKFLTVGIVYSVHAGRLPVPTCARQIKGICLFSARHGVLVRSQELGVRNEGSFCSAKTIIQ